MSILNHAKYSLIAGFILVSLFAGLDLVPEEAEASSPTATITLDAVSKVARVEPGELGNVVFTGKIVVDAVGPGSSVQYIRVELWASSQNNWPTTISPAALTAQAGGGEFPFQLMVRAAPATSYTVSDIVTIAGRAIPIPPGTRQSLIPDTTCSVLVEQYYRFSVECAKPYVQTSPASQVVYNIKVNNEGNGLDKFIFDVGNMDSLTKKQFTVQLSTTSIEIAERESENIRLTVSTPIEFLIFYKNELDAVQLVVKSYGATNVAGLPLEEKYFVYVRQKGSYIPGFEATYTMMALAALAGIMGGIWSRSPRRRRK